MRFKSEPRGVLPLFAVTGTNVVSFGVKVDKAALDGVLGFSVKRFDHQTKKRDWVEGYKVFRSVVPDPTPTTKVSTRDHPIQSLIWDDFYVVPGGTYDYGFYPFNGTPQKPDLTTAPATLSVEAEPRSASRATVSQPTIIRVGSIAMVVTVSPRQAQLPRHCRDGGPVDDQSAAEVASTAPRSTGLIVRAGKVLWMNTSRSQAVLTHRWRGTWTAHEVDARRDRRRCRERRLIRGSPRRPPLGSPL